MLPLPMSWLLNRSVLPLHNSHASCCNKCWNALLSNNSMQICMHLQERARICTNMQGHASICAYMQGHARACKSMQDYANRCIYSSLQNCSNVWCNFRTFSAVYRPILVNITPKYTIICSDMSSTKYGILGLDSCCGAE